MAGLKHHYYRHNGQWVPKAEFETFEEAGLARLRIFNLTGKVYATQHCQCGKFHLRRVKFQKGGLKLENESIALGEGE